MISELITEAVVFVEPKMNVAPNGLEYLSLGLGLFDIKQTGQQTFTRLDCTLWDNVALSQKIMLMDLGERDRVLVSGKFSIKKYKNTTRLRLYIHDLSLLSKATVSNKEVEFEMENIDYSILEDNMKAFDTDNVQFQEKRFIDKADDLASNDDF